MAVTALYQGKSTERNKDGITTVETYSGTKTDCETYAASKTIGASYSGLGILDSISIAQLDGTIYSVTLKYQNANGQAGTTPVIPPNYEFGQKSGSLDGTMMSTSLEIHKNASGQYDYLWNWNHFLLGRMAKAGGTTPTTPDWWEDLGADPTTGALALIPVADQETFQWSETGSVPLEEDYVWIVLEPPTMPGYQSYDRALYTWTESARYRDLATALSMVSSQVNKRGTPTYLPPNTPFVAGNWKCDRATVEYTGEFWKATLTWTYSPDGWNTTLYQATP